MDKITPQLQSLLNRAKAFLAKAQERLYKLVQSKNSQPAPQLLERPLAKKVKAELLEAGNFIQTKLLPTLLGFVSKVVEKIDPPLSKALTKVTSNPTVMNTGQKLQATSFWKKASISIAPIGRSLAETLKPLTTSESVRPILAKPVGTVALVLVLTLLLSLKPHAVRAVAVVQPIPKPELIEFIASEAGDAPISPEKVLVTSIQAQVVDISKSYGEALIASVQTNFRLGRLIVQLSDAWYQLNPELQEQLVVDLEKRSQALSFKKLFLLDTEQHLLARTSAIATEGGTEMIILRR